MNNDNLIDLYETYLTVERQYSDNTKINYIKDIRQFCEVVEIKVYKVEEDDALRYYEFLRNSYTNNTLLRKLSSVKNFYKYCLSEDLIAKNPFENIKASKKQVLLPKYLTQDEINLFLDSLSGDKALDYRNKAMFELLYATGMRVSELINLKVSNINLNEGFVLVFGKGSKERIVPISNQSLLYCKEYLNKYRPFLMKEDTDVLFLNTRGNKLSRQGVYKLLKQKCEEVGIYDVSPHKLRHSIATHLLNGGANMKIIQEILGHSDISTVQIYAHVSNDKIKNEYEKYHPLSQK